MAIKKTLTGIAVGATLLSAPIVPVGEMKLIHQSVHICNEDPTYYPTIPGQKPVQVDRGYSDPLFCTGSFSVAEFEDSNGTKQYEVIQTERYASTTKKGGEQYNSTKEEMQSLIQVSLNALQTI